MVPGQLLQVLASAVLLILSFPRPDAGILSLIALVPLLSALSSTSWWKASLFGWACGTFWFFVSYNWVSHSVANFGNIPLPFAQVLILLMAGIHGFYLGLFSALIPLVSGKQGTGGERSNGSRETRFGSSREGTGHLASPCASRWAKVLILPSAWVVLEVLRSWFPVPFPWLLMGTAARKIPFAGSLLEIAGVHGISWWIVAVNVLIWNLVREPRSLRRETGLLLAAALLLPILNSALHGTGGGTRLKVGVVQGNIRQELKWEEDLRDETVETYLSLTVKAVDKGAGLVVWPETAVPSYYQAEPELRERLKRFASDRNIHLIFGSPGFEISGREIRLYNRVYHLSPDGGEEFYDKVRLVPFGEYVPFATLVPFVDKMVPGEGEFARGTWKSPFQTPVPSGALVCYEIAIPSLARREVLGGSRLLINVTNDAWFGRSWGPYQHLVLSSVRARENSVPVLRAANTGISAIIDRDGRVKGRIPLEERGVLVGEVVTGERQTIYTRFGDWIVIPSAAVLSVYLLVLINLWRSRKWTA